MVAIGPVEQVLDPGFKPHAGPHLPVAANVDHAIAATGLLIVGDGHPGLLRCSDRFGAERPIGLFPGRGEAQRRRRDAVESIADVPTPTSHIGRDAVQTQPVRQAQAKVHIEAIQFGGYIGEAQRRRIAVHRRDHLHAGVSDARRVVERHAMDVVVHPSEIGCRPGVGAAGTPVETAFHDPGGFRPQVSAPDIGIAVGQASAGLGRHPGEAFDRIWRAALARQRDSRREGPEFAPEPGGHVHGLVAPVAVPGVEGRRQPGRADRNCRSCQGLPGRDIVPIDPHPQLRLHAAERAPPFEEAAHPRQIDVG